MRVAEALADALNRAGLHAEAVALGEELGRRRPGSARLEDVKRAIHRFDEASSRTHAELLPALRLARDGKLDEATAAFREALGRCPSKALIHYSMGTTYFEARRYDEAEPWFQEAARSNERFPTFVVGWSQLRLGNTLDLRHRRAEARRAYRLALESAGDDPHLRAWASHLLKHPYEP